MATIDRAVRQENERAYREHNITRTSEKMVPDIEGRPTPVSRPNNPHEQCSCEKCRCHRKQNSVTGVATPKRNI